jgi:hypothetical protein
MQAEKKQGQANGQETGSIRFLFSPVTGLLDEKGEDIDVIFY